METKTITWDHLKQALISIAIGTVISILTVLFQEVVQWLKHIQPEVPGAVVGMGRYLIKWTSHHNV